MEEHSTKVSNATEFFSACERTSTKAMNILGYINSVLVGSTYLIKTTAGGGRQKHDKEDCD